VRIIPTLYSLLIVAALSNNAMAEKTYVYKENDGTVWYTNVTPSSQDSTRYKLIEVKGRQTVFRIQRRPKAGQSSHQK